MNIVIVEDEKPAARRLERMLNDLGEKVNKTLHSVATSVKWFEENNHPDLIFLDIQLSDGLSFEIFEKTKITCQVIFTTAYDEYALKAFKLNSIDYLLKPIDDEDLKKAMNKYHHFNSQKNGANETFNLEQIKQLLSTPQKTYKDRFTVKVGQHIRSIKTEDVECFYSENKASFIFTNTERNYPVDFSLEQLEELLDPSIFFRVSRKFFVNINSIKDILAYSNSRLKIKMTNYQQDEIIVSRERVKEFKTWLG
ncbi:DNA-binding response regulator [Ancylomarina euxinus]|uniref:DNA-binding response regulator n=1 Tax=Ancylomarina euxinus TaxID=2283627 RepID=A0A425Y127_9BACT|nr:LytTR family DNA-binding domain-containing protein [Ancylomarina euxinus]MCZ4693740.1 LytTR family DNA-binding domain-containing protein [Ancylomarina euxinus]MUP15180.1 response regulator [Ancylomarina euxinus]RRG21602.1 DNA-binding response regulator [Ancylomarina euxinus]